MLESSQPATLPGRPSHDATGELARRRARIDELDGQLMQLIRERSKISTQIQQARLLAGGVRMDTAREREICRRYRAALGPSGAAIGSAVLRLCRGQQPDCGASPLRLGEFSFLNCAPIRWARGGSGVPAMRDTPDAVAAALLRGDLDLAPISLVEYLRHTDDLVALPELSIGSDGPVMSCQLVAGGPLRSLSGGTVALCSTSRTAALLARLLLEEHVGLRPDYRVLPPDLTTMLDDADGAVLIGDPALHATYRPPTGVVVHDLGALWREWTGLPMVFAVWAVRRDVVRERPDDVRIAHAHLLGAVRRGAANAPAVAADVAPRSSLTVAELLAYFTNLNYRLDERQTAGITRFAALAAAHGAVPSGAGLEFADLADPTGVIV